MEVAWKEALGSTNAGGANMAITNTVTDRTRHQRERVVFGGAVEIARTPQSSTADDAKVPAGRASAGGPVALGPATALARLLIATMRRMAAGPVRRERVRANADLLLETIRAHSLL
jgi:hypothetical protein